MKGRLTLVDSELKLLSKGIIQRPMKPQPTHYPKRKAMRWEWGTGKSEIKWRSDTEVTDNCQHCGWCSRHCPIGKFGKVLTIELKDVGIPKNMEVVEVSIKRVDGKWMWNLKVKPIGWKLPL